MKTKTKKYLHTVKVVIIVIGVLGVLGIPQMAAVVNAQNNHVNLIQSRNSMGALAEQENRIRMQKADKKATESNSESLQLTSERTVHDKSFRVPAEKVGSEHNK